MKKEQMFTRSREKSAELLVGAIDIHVHPGPHLLSSPRSTNPIECAEEARAAGMRALVFMDVMNVSSGTAWLTEQVVEGIRCFGGIILSTACGSLNPRAVMNATTYGNGARFVSFGAHCTFYQANTEGRYEDGEWILLRVKYPKFAEDEMPRKIRIPEGPPSKELKEILEIIAANPQIYMISGHVSPQEAIRLGILAKDFGIKKYLISSHTSVAMTDKELTQAFALGAYIEHTFSAGSSIAKTHYYAEYEYRSGGKSPGFDEVQMAAERIRKYGAEHFVCGTDLGVYNAAKPVEGMRQYIASLMDEGLSDEQICMVTSTNPGWLLDLND